MKCSNCNKKISKDSVFCEYCGTEVEKQPQPTKIKKTKKGNVGIIIVSLLLLISISANAVLAWRINAIDTNRAETISKLNSEIRELEKHTYPSSIIDRTEVTIDDKVNINNLKSIGSFSSISELKKALQRNIDNPQYMKVQITGYIVRTDTALYICTDLESERFVKYHIEKGDGISAYESISNDSNYISYIRIYMLDDTKDRVLTGDKVKITGVLNTKAMYVYKCTYEFIK